jgi:NAD(P)H-flavin reductase
VGVSATHDPMVPRFAAVASVHRETHDVVTLTLETKSWDGAFAFEPGQFNMLYAFGLGEVAISISGDPAERDRLVHTIRAVGAVTKHLVALRRGDSIGVRGPYGAPWPVEAARGKDVIVMAGGLGLAPLRPAIHRLIADRESFGRVSILVGARAPEEIVFAKELERWGSHHDVHVTVDRAGPDWKGHVGVVTTLVEKATFRPESALAFLCGPEVMMRFSARALEQRGVGADRIHVSLERNMKCAVGFCGHCQLGPEFLCRDGPVLRQDRVAAALATREL